jgi:hypothetical protein
MFDRLLRDARIAMWASVGITIAYISADAVGMTIPHEGAVWVILAVSVAVSVALFVELKSRCAMCDKVNTEVEKIKEAMNNRMNAFERHTLGHTVAEASTVGCTAGSTDS